MPRGPKPMHASVRQRRNTTSTAAELAVLPPEDRAKLPVPALPSDRVWDPRVSEWWQDAWQAPMRLEWDQADTHALLRIAYMLDEFYRAVDAGLPPIETPRDHVDALRKKIDAITKLSKAITDTSARLGLDPFARRSLQWLLVQTEKAEAETAESKERTAASREKRSSKGRGGRGGLGALT